MSLSNLIKNIRNGLGFQDIQSILNLTTKQLNDERLYNAEELAKRSQAATLQDLALSAAHEKNGILQIKLDAMKKDMEKLQSALQKTQDELNKFPVRGPDGRLRKRT